MEKLKFRAWNFVVNTMFTCEEMAHDQMTLLPNGQWINVNPFPSKSVIYPHDVMIPLLYTGLNDSTGKEIYVGDIVENDSVIKKKFEVVFKNYAFEFDNLRIAQRITFPERYPFQEYLSILKVLERNIKVIGNIYENPELIQAI